MKVKDLIKELLDMPIDGKIHVITSENSAKTIHYCFYNKNQDMIELHVYNED